MALLILAIVITVSHIFLASCTLSTHSFPQGIGAGCIKSNVAPMVAEQYVGKMRKKTLKSGEVVIVSPDVTIQSIYLCAFDRSSSYDSRPC
jgi:dipeptide/tripeptide permease